MVAGLVPEKRHGGIGDRGKREVAFAFSTRYAAGHELRRDPVIEVEVAADALRRDNPELCQAVCLDQRGIDSASICPRRS